MKGASLILVGILLILVFVVILVLIFNSGEGGAFPHGVYYQYLFSEEQKSGAKEIDVDLILEELKIKEVPVREAWFKPYSSSCCPPGQEEPVICMQAVVEPILIIRLEQEREVKNFIRTEEPDMGWCDYKVEHYDLKSRN